MQKIIDSTTNGKGDLFRQDLTGIATLSHDPLATYHLAGRKATKHKGSRK